MKEETRGRYTVHEINEISWRRFQITVITKRITYGMLYVVIGARCSSVVRAFAHDAMGRRIDPSWGGPIELVLVPTSAPRLV